MMSLSAGQLSSGFSKMQRFSEVSYLKLLFVLALPSFFHYDTVGKKVFNTLQVKRLVPASRGT